MKSRKLKAFKSTKFASFDWSSKWHLFFGDYDTVAP